MKSIFFILLLLVTPSFAREIKKVAPIRVNTPAGTVPRLPWQVWAEYGKGRGEWRQVRWQNSALETELQEADTLQTPAGSRYTVQGFILGDDTTPQGYPIKAEVTVVSASYDAPAPAWKVRPLPLGDVHLTGNNRLTGNRQLDTRMLLSLDVSQQLYNFRDTYGLPTEGYKVPDGWDSPTTKLKGHGTGHYMSALAFAFASATDADTCKLLKERIVRVVDELRQCQERTFLWSDSLGRYWEARDYAPEDVLKNMKGNWAAFDEYKKDYIHYGYGYLNAIPAAHPALIECYRAYNNEEWVWAPYYTIHKILAGLIDIANNIDDKATSDKALLIARDMGLWVWNRMHYRTFDEETIDTTRPGNRRRMWNMYIAGEVGGMAESLSRLSEMVSDPQDKARLIEAANCFDAPILFGNVARNIDDVRTRHANQHIPMFVGALRSYLSNHNPYYYNLAQNFWDMMQGRYVYAMGGVGNGEMWRQPYSQMVSMNTNAMSDSEGHRIPNPDLNETCCAYNLAKLTRDLNCLRPDDARYMDYYERVLYNQIVGSVHPTEYGVCYQYAVGLNARKPFGSPTPQETCCGGTGAENHVKYQECTYFVGDSTLYIALYMPTEALWREKGVRIKQQCSWPAEKSVISISQETEAPLSIKLRVPYWATEGFCIKLNGKPLAKKFRPCSYYEIPARRWQETDVIEVTMPFVTHIHYGADKMDMALTHDDGGMLKAFPAQWMGALMHGPLVMTSPDIHTWEEAVLDPDAAPTATFIPDYMATGHTTHYLRVKPSKETFMQDALATEQVSLATVRLQQPEAWAPHGFRRMQQALEQYNALPTAENAAILKVAIISMRPSNLAEPEDLEPLLQAMKESTDKEALAYARMVVRYVNDGSGTHDMIRKALERLRKAQG